MQPADLMINCCTMYQEILGKLETVLIFKIKFKQKLKFWYFLQAPQWVKMYTLFGRQIALSCLMPTVTSGVSKKQHAVCFCDNSTPPVQRFSALVVLLFSSSPNLLLTTSAKPTCIKSHMHTHTSHTPMPFKTPILSFDC